MAYINRLKLMETLIANEPINAAELLSDIRQDQVVAALNRSKDGLPKAIRVTDSPMEEENFAKMPGREKMRLQKFTEQVLSEPLVALPKLLKFQTEFPNVPAISNCINIVYQNTGQDKLALASLWDTRKRYPDYLFGKIGLAEYYLQKDRHIRVPEVFENKLELWQHLPDRDLFHISEARAFWSVVGSYYARRKNMARSLYHYMLLTDIAPDHPAATNVGNEIILQELNKLSKNAEKRR